MEIIKFALLVLLGYLLGNISISRLIKKDITKSGSGNPGTMNMLRTYGLKMGILTLFCDALKAAIPALVGRYVLFPGNEYLSVIAMFVGGFSAVIGHMYPALYNFRGGKGIASTIGMFIVANPLLALAILVADLIFFLIVKIGSLASMFFIIIFAVVHTFISGIQYNYVAMILMWVVVIIDVVAHRTNFIRLFANEERLINFKESVKKDLERVEDKKLEKLDDLKEKEEELKEHLQEKLEKKEEAIKSKHAKSMKKVAKKRVKLQQRYNWKVQQIKAESNDIIKDMQSRIDKRNEKQASKEDDISDDKE